MSDTGYTARRGAIETYFDRTAHDAWRKLTSTDRVSRIRETVRAGRDAMRARLLSWLPGDLTGTRLLDAGCGTGALADEAAARGAMVCAVDVSARLVELARERAMHGERIAFHAGDMLSEAYGRFDHAVAMDSLIHYETNDAVASLGRLAARVQRSIVFTFPPRTMATAAMHMAGKFFPRSDRSPAIVPVSEARLRALIGASRDLDAWRIGRTDRIVSGFYLSQAMELVRA
jgi:magnesium-protoporphyrin O-methyltransferase